MHSPEGLENTPFKRKIFFKFCVLLRMSELIILYETPFLQNPIAGSRPVECALRFKRIKGFTDV